MTNRLPIDHTPDILDWHSIDKPTQDSSLDDSQDEETTSDWQKVDNPTEPTFPYQDLTQLHAPSTLIPVSSLTPPAALDEWYYYSNLNPRLDPRTPERKSKVRTRAIIGALGQFHLFASAFIISIILGVAAREAAGAQASHKPTTSQVGGRWTCHWEPDPPPAGTVAVEKTHTISVTLTRGKTARIAVAAPTAGSDPQSEL